jgi:hypothetical protein
MKLNYSFLLLGLIGPPAFADPVVGTRATYDYRRESEGKSEQFVQTKEVLELHSAKKTYSEKTTYIDSEGKIVKEGIVPDQPFERFEISDIFFVVQCATHLNGKTVDGVKYSFEDVTVPMGSYKSCHMTYIGQEGLVFDEYIADGIAFNAVKTVITDPANGVVRTSELRSIANP